MGYVGRRRRPPPEAAPRLQRLLLQGWGRRGGQGSQLRQQPRHPHCCRHRVKGAPDPHPGPHPGPHPDPQKHQDWAVSAALAAACRRAVSAAAASCPCAAAHSELVPAAKEPIWEQRGHPRRTMRGRSGAQRQPRQAEPRGWEEGKAACRLCCELGRAPRPAQSPAIEPQSPTGPS